MIPFVILYIVAYGLSAKVNIFDEFTKGAKDGIRVVAGILPTLTGLMVAIGILRSSGTLDMLSKAVSPLVRLLHFPAELIPLVTIKMFSSSAATSLLLDVFKEFGTDSRLGIMASLLLSSSETIFYTMSVYFMVAGVTKTRWTLAGSLLATLGSVVASVVLVGFM